LFLVLEELVDLHRITLAFPSEEIMELILLGLVKLLLVEVVVLDRVMYHHQQ
tara:strand:+ start:206 stop:361 length:156 start_codon:yes stop_codon:yes gene_type:complete